MTKQLNIKIYTTQWPSACSVKHRNVLYIIFCLSVGLVHGCDLTGHVAGSHYPPACQSLKNLHHINSHRYTNAKNQCLIKTWPQFSPDVSLKPVTQSSVELYVICNFLNVTLYLLLWIISLKRNKPVFTSALMFTEYNTL